MKENRSKNIRTSIQIAILVLLLLVLIQYNLYTSQLVNFKIISIGDLNPYGAWSALKESLTDSSYEFDGINRSMALTISILVISIAGGRFFCGWICPIGTIQDISNWIGKKLVFSKHNGLGKKDFNPLYTKYPILLAVLLASILGYGATIAEFSPWRAMLNIPKLFSAWKVMKTGFAVLAGIFIVSAAIPRFFCRYLCPLGAAQTLFSSFSLISIKQSKSCIHCNGCLNSCTMALKLSPKEDSISPECIRCLECIGNCKINEDTNLGLKSGRKNISSKNYIALMFILFFVIWLGMPKVFGGTSMISSIPLSNLKDGVYQGEAKGFAARIITEVRIENGKIVDITVLDHHESRGWYEEVFMVLPKEIIRKQRIEADVISGATKTSKGFIKSIENAIKKAM